ncbi:MAG: hypothetical protein ACP5QZ_11240 [Candidatus Sumerlaeaceae bacterium]
MIRLYDVTELQRLRESLSPRWWESGLRILLFVSGLGFAITVYKLIPSANSFLFGFVFFWFILFILTMLGLIEYLVLKVRALTRFCEYQGRLLDHMLKKSAVRSTLADEATQAHSSKSG